MNEHGTDMLGEYVANPPEAVWKFDVRHALFVFFRRRRLGTFVVFMTLLGVFIGNYLTYPVFESTTKILIERAAGSEIPFSREQIAFKKAEITRTQGELLTSLPVLEAVVTKLGLDCRPLPSGSLRDSVHAFGRKIWGKIEDLKQGTKRLVITKVLGGTYTPPAPPDPFREAVESLRRRIHVEPLPSTDILALTVKDPDGEFAAIIVNEMTSEYLARNLDAQRQRARSIYNALDAQVLEFKPRFDLAEQAVESYEDEYQARLISERISSKMQEISTLDVTHWEIVETKRAKLVSLRLQLVRLEQVYDATHPKVVTARSELEEAKRRFELGSTDPADGQGESDGEFADQLKTRIAEAREELAQMTAQEATYSRLLRKKDQEEDLLVFLLKKREEAQIAEATRLAGTRVIEAAVAPTRPSRPRKRLNLLLGFLGGLLAAGILAGLLEFCDRSVKTPTDVQRASGLEVIGVIPDWRRSKISDGGST